MSHDTTVLCALLADLEAEIHHPGQPCTAQRLDELLHADFHEIGRSGIAYSRQEVIDALVGKGGSWKGRAVNHRVDRLSDTLALLLFESDQPAAGGEREHAARRASLWQLAGGRWQLRYHHATPVKSIDTPE